MVEARVDRVKTKTTEDFDFETDFGAGLQISNPGRTCPVAARALR